LPGKILILNAIGIVLQYSLMLLLYYFLFKVARLAYSDLADIPLAPRPVAPTLPLGNDSRAEEASLVVVSSGQVKLSQPLYKLGETITIGRTSGNDIVINDSFVSHEHACISRYKHGFWLADLQSTNGTLLNKRQLKEETCLKDGDIITIGATTFRFER